MKVDVTICDGNGCEVELTPGGFFLVFDAKFTGTGFVPTAEAGGLITVKLGPQTRVGAKVKAIRFTDTNTSGTTLPTSFEASKIEFDSVEFDPDQDSLRALELSWESM